MVLSRPSTHLVLDGDKRVSFCDDGVNGKQRRSRWPWSIVLATASCSTMEASKRDGRNDGDGISFEVDGDLEELSCSSMAKEGDGRLVACSRGSRVRSMLHSSRMDEKGLQ